MGAGGSGIGGNAVMEGNGNNGTDHTGSGGGGVMFVVVMEDLVLSLLE